MTLKQAKEKVKALSFVVEELNIYSSLGRRILLESQFCTDKSLLLQRYAIIAKCEGYLSLGANRKTLKKVRAILACLHDIKGTMKQLASGVTLDDISLFEIKFFAIEASRIKSLLFDFDCSDLVIDDLEGVISILDPEGLHLNQFYIYNAYSKELAQKRKAWEEAQEDKKEALYLQCSELEDTIRQELCQKLFPYKDTLEKAIQTVGKIDMFFAMAEYFSANGFSAPEFTQEISYSQLTYPPLVKKLSEEGKQYQPIDICLTQTPTLVSGANMAGKTILLKSLQLAQLLAQFGFFVPAKQAQLPLVCDVLTSIGDRQNEDEGLSSYGSEILILNDIIKKVKQGNQYLVLVDELARTTNPKEGVALVDSFISILSNYCSFSVITTHYSGIKTKCYRLRVRGFIHSKEQKSVSIADLSSHIDYSLIEDKEERVPNEALNIAELLGVDSELISKAREFIK